MKFKLNSKFKIIPEQENAIKELVGGVEKGVDYQVLLGVTGSGKSLSYEEPVLVYKKVNGGYLPKILPIGELVEANIKEGMQLFTHSINPKNGEQGIKQIIQYTKHKSPRKMYLVTTSCGKEVTVTGDHNFWVIRDGAFKLVKTNEITTQDFLPAPRVLNFENKIPKKGFLVTSFLKRKTYFRISEINPKKLILQLKKLLDYQKYYHFKRSNEAIDVSYLDKLDLGENILNKVKIFAKNSSELPIYFSLTKELLYLMGFYIAEGHAEKNYLLLSVHEKNFQNLFISFVKKLKIKSFERKHNKGDFQINNSLLTDVFSSLLGINSRSKKLPGWYLELSERQLSYLLSSYFSGDGTVTDNEIQAVTASKKLTTDLCYALLRYGIKARVRKKVKYAANTVKKIRRQYFEIIISGKENLTFFKNKIGFILKRKQSKLQQIIRRNSNTNVDFIPLNGSDFRILREKAGLSQNTLSRIIGCSRSHFSLIEGNKRKPSKNLIEKAFLFFDELNNEHYLDNEINQLKTLSNIFSSRVKSIQVIDTSSEYVYDIAVRENETFLAGMGIYVHNTFTMANVIEKLQRPTLIISHNKTLAAQLYQELRDFFPKNAVSYFVSYYDYYQPESYIPSTDTYIEKDSDINELIDKLRLAATTNLLTRPDTIVVASVSCIYNIGSPREYGHFVFEFGEGMKIARRQIIDRLIDLQYERSDFGFYRGTFRVRGDSIDIFPAYTDEAMRVELAPDHIKKVSMINPVSGQTINNELLAMNNFVLYPAKHFMTDPTKHKEVFDQIKHDLDARVKELKKQGKLLEAQRISQRVTYDLEMIQEVGYVKGIENYSRYFDGRKPGEAPYSLLDYFPLCAGLNGKDPARNASHSDAGGWLVIVDESHMTFPQIRGMYAGDLSRKTTLVDYGFRLPAAIDNRPLKFDEFMRRIPNFIATSATPSDWELSMAKSSLKRGGFVGSGTVEQLLRPTGIPDPEVEIRPTKNQVADVIEEIKKQSTKKQRTLVTTLTKRTAEDLASYLSEQGLRVHYLHSDVKTLDRTDILDDLRFGKYDVLVGINLLREGLDLPEVSLVAILDADKEGFLRSDVTLIQTMGRAARHVEGHVIMYADTITGSMQRALDEVKRRREYQLKMNKKFGIIPRSIEKPIRDKLIEREEDKRLPWAFGSKEPVYNSLPSIDLDGLTPMDKKRLVKNLRREMLLAAQDLNFELAAEIRDKIKEI